MEPNITNITRLELVKLHINQNKQAKPKTDFYWISGHMLKVDLKSLICKDFNENKQECVYYCFPFLYSST